MPSGAFLGAFGESLSNQIEKGLEARRKRQEEERKPLYQLTKALLAQPSSRDVSALQSQSNVLEQTAQPGSSFNMQAALSRSLQGPASRTGAIYDQRRVAMDVLNRLKGLGLGGITGEGITFGQPNDFSTQMAALIAALNPGSKTPQSPVETPLSTTTSAEQSLNPTNVYPGQVLFESGTRAVGRGLRMRETQRTLTGVYRSRTAAAAKAFEDSGNIAVQERKLMEQANPSDDDSYIGRVTKEQSFNNFAASKEAELNRIIHTPIQQILVGGSSRSGPRYALDPSALAKKKQAEQDLLKLQKTKVLYQEMFREADQKMPPIGATVNGGSNQEDPYMAEARERGLL